MPAHRLARALAAFVVVAALTGCGAQEPTPAGTPTPAPTTTESSPSANTPSVDAGITLRQLGFENGPPDFSLPSDAVVSTSVDQPNVVTIVLSRPSPDSVEDFLRASLPAEGFTISARGSGGNGAMTFQGNGWTGGFTATAATSAIVLRPA